MNLSVIVIGAGGHARVLMDTLRLQKREIIGVTVLEGNRVKEAHFGLPIIGGDEAVFHYSPAKVQLVNGIGSVTSLEIRKQIFDCFKAHGYSFANVIHPSAIIASEVLLSEGVQIMAGTVIQTGTNIGLNSIINTQASIDHDCRIGNHVHIAPGTILSGGVVIGEGTHIGTGAKVIQGIHIGKNSLIGAGSLVLKDTPDGSKAYGVPARVVSDEELEKSNHTT